MNILGRTNDSGLVVQLTKQEATDLARLRDAMESQLLTTRNMDQYFYDYDYNGTFGAVRAFAMARFAVNELKATVERLEKSLSDPQPAPVDRSDALRRLNLAQLLADAVTEIVEHNEEKRYVTDPTAVAEMRDAAKEAGAIYPGIKHGSYL